MTEATMLDLMTESPSGPCSFICPLRYQGCGLYMEGICIQTKGDTQFWNCETFRDRLRTMKRYIQEEEMEG